MNQNRRKQYQFMRRNLIIDLYNFKSSGGKLICMVSKNVYFLSPFIINIIYIISNMSQNPRKYVTAERSVQKEGYRSSYQGNNTIKTYDSNFYELNKGNSPSYYQNPREERQRISQTPKATTDSIFNPSKQYMKGNLLRRKNEGMVSNLKSDLQNLKMQVGKLMNKQTNNKLSSAKKMKTQEHYEDPDRSETSSVNSFEHHRQLSREVSDTCSVTSQRIIDEPLKKLQNQFGSGSYDHSHYLQLENNLLKTQLRNLKNKYNAKKQELKQKCEALEQKNEYLQVSLHKSERSLAEYKKALDSEIQLIKTQVSRQLDKEVEEQRIPSHDFDSGNELIEGKMKELYEELTKKNKLISTLNIELNEVRGLIEKKSFELKKEVEKNMEKSKQNEFSKRQISRLQTNFEMQINKNAELQRVIQNFRQKNSKLTIQLKKTEQMVQGSQECESKLEIQLKDLKGRQQRLKAQYNKVKGELKKCKQLNESDKQQIGYLKENNRQFMHQLETVSKLLRLEKEKVIETEENYRKIIDEAKNEHEKQFQKFKREQQLKAKRYQELRKLQVQQVKKVEDHENHRDKDRQISRWKAQYKLLKIKYDEIFSVENSKKQEIQTYYKCYKEYKLKIKVLEMKNQMLSQSANESIQKMQQIQINSIEQGHKYEERIRLLQLQNSQIKTKINEQEVEKQELREKISTEVQKNTEQTKYRKKLQEKILNMDTENVQDLTDVIEKVKKRVNEQDQKINKYVKDMKNKETLISKLKNQVKELMESKENEMQELNRRYKNEKMDEFSSNFVIHSLEQTKKISKQSLQIQIQRNNQLLEQVTKYKGSIGTLESEMGGLKRQIKDVTHLYNLKSQQHEDSVNQMHQKKDSYERKIQHMESEFSINIQKLKSEISIKNTQIQEVRREVKALIDRQIQKNQFSGSFDDALKTQIQTGNKLREEIKIKNEDIYRLRDSYSSLRAQFDNLKSQFDIERLKFLSEKKNVQMLYDIEVRHVKRSIQVEMKKVNSLQEKIKSLVEENKKKDSFIQQFLIGKRLPQSEKQLVSSFMKEYQIFFDGKSINQKLKSQSQQIQKLSAYNLNLLKQLAEMKEKMVLYEAISVDNRSETDMECFSPEVSFKVKKKSSALIGIQ